MQFYRSGFQSGGDRQSSSSDSEEAMACHRSIKMVKRGKYVANQDVYNKRIVCDLSIVIAYAIVFALKRSWHRSR